MIKVERLANFITIPICWLQQVWSDPCGALNMALGFGIVYWGRNMEPTIDQAAGQLLYDYYRGGDLRETLKLRFEGFIAEDVIRSTGADVTFDYYQNFDPDISNLPEVMEKNPEFKKLVIENYQIHQVCELSNIKKVSKDEIIQGFTEVDAFRLDQERMFGKQPMAGLNLEIVKKVGNNNIDLELFAGYAAIKSLVGSRDFAKTFKGAIVQRMIGAKSNDAEDYLTKNYPGLKIIRDKYINRYHFDKLLQRLLNGNFIKSMFSLKNVRGIYVSTRLDMKGLPKEVAISKRKNDLRSQQKEEALKIYNRELGMLGDEF